MSEVAVKIIEIFVLVVSITVVPWSIWVTVRSFEQRQKTALLQQEVAFLKTNLVDDISTIKKQVEASTAASVTFAKEAKESNDRLNDKIDRFMGQEISILKSMIEKQ